MERASIAVIGAGNVASHLARALDARDRVVQVCARHIDHARALAGVLKDCEAIDDASALRADCDFYLIAVNDDSIPDVSASMPDVSGVVMHTSGSVPMSVLSRHPRHGVFYPLQTFSARVPVDISQVPLFIEASEPKVFDMMRALARSISHNVDEADSAQRAALHVAAVFGCNFVNHMLELADAILSSHGYPLDVLKPLLQVTIDKAMDVGPHAARTGPAVRRDTGTMDRHLASLPSHSAEIYRLLSQSIISAHP